MPFQEPPPRRSDVATLTRLIGVHAPYDGIFELRVPGVYAIRISRTNIERTHAIQQASLCIVAQGAKTVGIGESIYQYEAGQIAVFSVDVPVTAQVTRAIPAEPYLTLKILLDPEKIAALAAKVYPHGLPQISESRALYVGDADDPVVDAVIRLLQLMAHPADADLVAPLVLDEILIRVLRTPIGTRVAQMGQTDSSLQRVIKAVSLLRSRFDQPVNVEELASLVNMSVSSFHRQFKMVTSMSPMQYQSFDCRRRGASC